MTIEKRRVSQRRRLWLAAGMLLVFCAIAYLVQTGHTATFDRVVDFSIYGLRGDVTNWIFTRITHIGDAKVVICVLVLVFLYPKTRRQGACAIATGLVGVGIYAVLKPAFGRARPDEALRLITESGFSFPSGHSMHGMICYGVLLFLALRSCRNPKVRRALIVGLALLIAIIGFSRIFVGVHYVTDVMGGWSIGLAFLLLVTVILDHPSVAKFYGGGSV